MDKSNVLRLSFPLYLPGSAVTAGTVNCDGSLSILVQKSGETTAMADIVRAVEAAQARAAPIQRLADNVAGRFAIGVMAASLATFAFWSTLGPTLFPQVCLHESSTWCVHKLSMLGPYRSPDVT